MEEGGEVEEVARWMEGDEADEVEEGGEVDEVAR